MHDRHSNPLYPPEMITQFVEANFHVTARSQDGEEWSVLCPSHGDNNASMRINVIKGVFYCHGCGIRGGLRKLGQLVGVTLIPSNEEEVRLAILQSKLSSLKKPVERKERVLPESILTRYRVQTTYWSEKRGLNDEIIRAFDLGYDPLEDCAIIPLRNIYGELLGVTRRWPDGCVPKYTDPKNFRKSDHLFGSWLARLDAPTTVVITEGPIDAMKVWQAGHVAVGQYGSYITAKQIRLLAREIGALQVVLFYDNDDGGRKAYRWALGQSTDAKGNRYYDPEHDLRKHFLVRKAAYRTSAKDPGSMTEQQINEAVTTARVIR